MNDSGAFDDVEPGMETDAFESFQLVKFDNVRLYRASDTPGGDWNTYGAAGVVRVNFIKRSDPDSQRDYRGWGQMTFHNSLTRAGGLNVLIVPNFTMLPSKQEPERLTFKALSRTVGNNGMRNMYSMKLSSSEDAARLWYSVFVLQLSASDPITLPQLSSLEATVARAFIGNQDEVLEHHLILSKLTQLAAANSSWISPTPHQWGQSSFASPFRPVENLHLGLVSTDANHSLDGSDEDSLGSSSVPRENTGDFAGSTQETLCEGDESSSLGSISEYVESQDWFASFKKPH